MTKDPAQDFPDLLTWLDPDRERAAEKYLLIRQQLIEIFAWNRASDPDGLADETITRVAHRVAALRDSYVGDPSRYFYRVARDLLREVRRPSKLQAEPKLDEIATEINDDASREQLYECLEKCLNELSADNREFGLQPSTLRMRVHRIKTTLEKCIENCMKCQNTRKMHN